MSTIGVIFGTWNLYEQVEEVGNFYDKFDVEEHTDDVFPIMYILWGDRLEELDSKEFDYEPYPAEWKGREGKVAVLETCHCAFEIDEELTSLDLVTTDGVRLCVYDTIYDDGDWDMQEAEEAIDLATGKQIDMWAE